MLRIRGCGRGHQEVIDDRAERERGEEVRAADDEHDGDEQADERGGPS
jgi:hypothetical protein